MKSACADPVRRGWSGYLQKCTGLIESEAVLLHGFLQAKKKPALWPAKIIEVGLSHPIADSVNQLSVASFMRSVDDVVELTVGDLLEIGRDGEFSVPTIVIIGNGK